MKEQPILFSEPMVQAILEGRKTQTRRIVSARNSLIDGSPTSSRKWESMEFDFDQAWVDQGPSPAGNPGPYLHVPSMAHGTVHRIYPRYFNCWDALWVRETWCNAWDDERDRWSDPPRYHYRADGYEVRHVDSVHRSPWQPSIHMPRKASRITLRITGVRIERLQEIGARDAIAEGIENSVIPGHGRIEGSWKVYTDPKLGSLCPISSYQTLWESIHGRGSWDANPWVCAITFERLS